MNFIPKEDAGLFLYGKAYDAIVSDGPRRYKKKKFRKAFALDIVNNIPIIKIYQQSEVESGVSGPVSNSYYYYFNNWRGDGSNGHIAIRREGSPGEWAAQAEDQVGGTSFVNRTGAIGIQTILIPVQDVNPSRDLWDPNRVSQNELYGNKAGTQGAFKVYNNTNNVTTSIAIAENRPDTGWAPGGAPRMYKANDTVDIANNTYNVLYDVTPGGHGSPGHAELIRVFLCKAPD